MTRSIQLQRIVAWGCVGFLALVVVVFAQEDEEWKRKNTFDNRYEGTKGFPVATPRLVLLSFIASPAFLPEGEPPDITLRVKFFLPRDASSAFLSARQLRKTQRLYWMEAVQTEWESQQWNEFTWPTKDFLRPKRIPLSTLGVTVRIGEKTGTRIAPTIIYTDTSPKAVTAYKLYFRPARTLHRVTHTLSTCETATCDTGKLVRTET
ncbi:MAG: hypothetical protein FJ147_05025 [Deltaproteobacteria bacterium]|nr:hypothetical protein [Deltaproteobacteria bacterium]